MRVPPTPHGPPLPCSEHATATKGALSHTQTSLPCNLPPPWIPETRSVSQWCCLHTVTPSYSHRGKNRFTKSKVLLICVRVYQAALPLCLGLPHAHSCLQEHQNVHESVCVCVFVNSGLLFKHQTLPRYEGNRDQQLNRKSTRRAQQIHYQYFPSPPRLPFHNR